MFTGIVQDVGYLERLEPRGGDLRLTVGVRRLDLAGLASGGSIAVCGVCLTAVAVHAEQRRFLADVSRETLQRTTIGVWQAGRPVNLELALRAGDPLGGHLLLGHVDGVAQLLDQHEDARSRRLRLAAPRELLRYLARKGSVALDGVSLTINTVESDRFEVNLIPHTLEITTLGLLQPGADLNLEVDLIARYVERLLSDSGRSG